MKGLLNFVRGMVTLTATGPFPERLINLCAQNRIDFWAGGWLDESTIRLTTRRWTLPRLRQFAEREGCEVRVEGSRGLPDFAARFRTRYAFLVGLALSLCAVMVLSRFVLNIEVTGNETVPTAVILSQLRQLGVRPGVYGPSIERTQVAQEALLRLDKLAWMAINLHGTRLEVIVREVVPRPERIDEGEFHDVVAEADGLITHVEAELGDAKVLEGDVVVAGDVLISGTVTMEPPKYSDLPPRYYQTHARGRVWARTWRTLTVVVPLDASVKEYTGEQKRAWALELLGHRIHLFGHVQSRSDWEKASWKRQLILPGEVALPVILLGETGREYRCSTVQLNLAGAQELLERHLAQRLNSLIGEDGAVKQTAYTAKVEGGLLRVSLQAECREEIGREVPGKPLEQPE